MDATPGRTVEGRGAVGAASVALAFLLLTPFVLALVPAAGAGGPPEDVPGDLIVISGETQVIQGRTLVVSGNVTVEAGGILELRNSTILLNLTANGTRALTVEAGGTLRVLDLDGARQTVFDRSQIASADVRLRYAAEFKAGSNVLVRNSALSGFGFSLASPGLLIESDNVTFSGAALDAYEYLRVEGASPLFESTTLTGDGTGSNYFFRSNATLSNCTLSGHFVALSAAQGSAVTLSGALIRDSTFSLAANGSALSVGASAVNNSSAGIYMTNASTVDLADVDFDPAAVSFGDGASELAASRSFTFAVLNNASEAVRNATVVVRDGANATVASGNTGAVGLVGPVQVLAFSANLTGRFDAPNYTATAQRPGVSASYVFAAAAEPNRVSLQLDSNIDPRITLLSPAPDAVLLAGLSELFAVNATDPDATLGGLTVSWRSSLDGALGSGTSLPLLLSPGSHTIEVEARDAAEGFRRLSFNVTVEVARAETAEATDSAGLVYSATLWKTSQGAFGITFATPPLPPALAVGLAVDIHSVSGAILWSAAQVELPFDPGALPYGTFAENLTVQHLVGGMWQNVAGAWLDINRSVVTVNFSRPEGLGWFLLVAQRGPDLAPALPEFPTLSAVVGNPFVFEVAAVDTPGDTISYALEGAPGWLTLGSGTGTLSGTPAASDRGLSTVIVRATDEFNATATRPLSIFVTGTLDNRPPTLLNPVFVPSRPLDRGTVTVEVTYLDPDDDLPLFVEVVIDGTAHPMDPVNLYDINTTNGKGYLFEAQLAAGTHAVSFRANDGAPGHADATLGAPALWVESDTLLTLNNWFLALFASVAATLVLVVYVRVRAPARPSGPKKDVPEDRALLLEGEALKPIAPQPLMAPRPRTRGEALEKEVDLEAAKAAGDERDARQKLDLKGNDE